ncbi:hypothetical protein PR048_007178 [Dryococelus australis]|uniref:Uncharacterized protein n=1 Tax=Dryococelus australis TaxID=614101 RepID=A0ABQ9ICY1_9NEOP|nr:hypothetical protein PR048_007178 [Dryococelus australis]
MKLTTSQYVNNKLSCKGTGVGYSKRGGGGGWHFAVHCTSKGSQWYSGLTVASHRGPTGFDSRRNRSRILACGNRAGRCRWSVGFLGDLPFPPPLQSSAAPYSPSFTLISSQDLDVRAAQISRLYFTPQYFVHGCRLGHVPRIIPAAEYETVFREIAVWIPANSVSTTPGFADSSQASCMLGHVPRIIPAAEYETVFREIAVWIPASSVSTTPGFADSSQASCMWGNTQRAYEWILSRACKSAHFTANSSYNTPLHRCDSHYYCCSTCLRRRVAAHEAHPGGGGMSVATISLLVSLSFQLPLFAAPHARDDRIPRELPRLVQVRSLRLWMAGRGKQQIPEKTRRPVASSCTISTCENPGVTRPWTESGSALVGGEQSNRSATAVPVGGKLRCISLGWRRADGNTETFSLRITRVLDAVVSGSPSVWCARYQRFTLQDDSQLDRQTSAKVSLEQRRNARAGETGDPRGNPLTNGIVRCENPGATSSVIEPGSPRWEASSLTTTPPRPHRMQNNEAVVLATYARLPRAHKHARYFTATDKLVARATPVYSNLIPLLQVVCTVHENALTPATGGATVAERLACSPPTKAIRVTPDFRMWESIVPDDAVGRQVFLEDLPFHSGAAPYSPRPPSSALKTSMLRAVQITSLTSDMRRNTFGDPKERRRQVYTHRQQKSRCNYPFEWDSAQPRATEKQLTRQLSAGLKRPVTINNHLLAIGYRSRRPTRHPLQLQILTARRWTGPQLPNCDRSGWANAPADLSSSPGPRIWSGAGMGGRGNGRSPRRPANQRNRPARCPHAGVRWVTRPGIEPGSPWWGAGELTAQPPRPHGIIRKLRPRHT